MAAGPDAEARFRGTAQLPAAASAARPANVSGQKRGTAPSEDSGRVARDAEAHVVPAKRSKEEVLDE
jgi:hypothetical protein